MVDNKYKSFAKTISWRIIGTMDTIVIAYFITGNLIMATSIGSIEVVTKMILYYGHERIWEQICLNKKINHEYTTKV